MTTWGAWAVFAAVIAIAVALIVIGAIDYVREHQ
jgi:hypothetical protein